MGKRVMLLDANLPMANVQLALGTHCAYNLSHFLSGEKMLQVIVVTSPSGVRLVSGAPGLAAMAKLSQRQVFSIVQGFSTLTEKVDFLIVDTATGLSAATLAFLTATPRRFLVVRDDLQSVLDVIAHIQVLVLDHGLDEIYLLTNGVGHPQNGQRLFKRINHFCAEAIGQSIHYIGAMGQHDGIASALKKGQSVLDFASESAAAQDFAALAQATDQLQPIGYASG